MYIWIPKITLRKDVQDEREYHIHIPLRASQILNSMPYKILIHSVDFRYFKLASRVDSLKYTNNASKNYFFNMINVHKI